MTPVEAMSMIEGDRFAALTNLASNMKTFLRIAAQQAEVAALSRAMASDAAVVSGVFQRALALSAMPADQESEAEGDAALATYLWLLKSHRPELAEAAAARFRERGHFFWARRFAENVCASRESGGRTGNGTGAGQETGQAAEHRAALPRKT